MDKITNEIFKCVRRQLAMNLRVLFEKAMGKTLENMESLARKFNHTNLKEKAQMILKTTFG